MSRLAATAEEERNSRHSWVSAAARALRGRRTSAIVGEPTSANPLNALHQHYAPLGYMLPWEVLDYVELLAAWNPDYSQAVDNIRTLANSGHDLFVDGSTRTANRVKELLQEKARTIQEPHGGIDGLIDKLLKQAATFGAMAGEWVLSAELDDVVDFVDINPKNIRFFWEDDHYAPYQKVKGDLAKLAEKKGQKVRMGNCVKLNEETFHYFAFDAAPESPYGVPPFIAALSSIAIQRDMVGNLSQIVKKVGLLGLVDLTIQQLPRIPAESDEQYESRAGAYLDEYVTVLESMLEQGGIVHFDDAAVTTTNIAGNAAGATNIFKQNEEQVFSGLKSMPSVQGRSYSTTETYAGVAYDIIIRNTYKYQRAAKRMIEKGYWLAASMAGENPTAISIHFRGNKTLQRLQNAQSEAIEIRNASLLWLAGLLDQMGFGQRLGFTAPKREMELPPPELVSGARSPSREESADEADSEDSGRQS